MMQKAIDVSKQSAVYVVNNNTPSLRDQFAMAALTGLYSHHLADATLSVSKYSEMAYRQADAMMETREK